MPTTYTDNLALNLPEVGASRDTWGALLNDNFTALDGFVSQAMPIGSVIDYAGPTAPAGWLMCSGQTVSRTVYSDLFAAIGVAWGPGDGTSTFRLPNTPGRASVGPGTVTDINGNHVLFTFGQVTGAVLQTIQQTHLPNYSLTVSTTGAHAHGGAVSAVGDHMHTGYTDTVGNHHHTVGAALGPPGPGSVAAGAYGYGALEDTSTDGAHIHTVSTYSAGGHAHFVTSDGSHTHTVSLGGGAQPLSVQSPVIVFNKIIFAGQQAAVTALTASAPERRRLLAAPLRGSH